jgi:hypothetical protein
VAARLVLKGATSLHGSLHRDSHRWKAELLGRAQELGEDVLWIERIQVGTSPVYDLEPLAERDALTRIVLETLKEAVLEPGALPVDIQDMLGVLPGEVRSDIEGQCQGAEGAAILEDVRAIILEGLGTKGGTAS